MAIYYESKDSNNNNNIPNSGNKSDQESPNNDSNNKKSKKGLVITIVIIFAAIIGYFSYSHFNNKPDDTPVLLDTCIANTNSDIYDYYKNSIVMVKQRIGLQIRLNESNPIILEDYYIKDSEFYASGFIIDQEGKIITNRHAVNAKYINSDILQTEIKNLVIKIASHLPKDTDPSLYEEKIYQIINNGRIYEQETTVAEVDSTDHDIDLDIEPTIVEYFSKEDIYVEPVSLELQVMLHDSDEWLSCKVITTSSEENEIDLALIQLESEKTPITATKYVNIFNANTQDSIIKPGSKAVMIGFPMGMNLANTNSGIIKSQMYEGDINKESDGVKFQYSIPSTQGASGAPVFNSCGQLIAVNFSGYDQRGFNFGIVAKHVLELASPYVINTLSGTLVDTRVDTSVAE